MTQAPSADVEAQLKESLPEVEKTADVAGGLGAAVDMWSAALTCPHCGRPFDASTGPLAAMELVKHIKSCDGTATA